MMKEENKNIVAFQYWGAFETQTSGFYYGEDAERFISEHDEYAQKNSVASLFYGTIEEAKEQFPELF